MKASRNNPKRASSPTNRGLIGISLLAGASLGACSDAKDQGSPAQNDTLYAMPAGINAEVRETFQLGAQRVKGGAATNVSDKVMWTTSDPRVVTVDSGGSATATDVGTATLSTNYDGFTASVNVKVIGRITSAEVEAAPITLAKGTSYKLGTMGIVEDFSKRALTGAQAWGSNDESVATVSRDGTVTAKGPGTAAIVLTYKNVSYPRNVTVADVPLDAVTMTPDNGTTVPTTMKTTYRVVGSFGGGAMTQNITNLFAASLSLQDSEFASASATAVTALAVPEGATEKSVTVTIAGARGSIAESFSEASTISIIDSTSLSSLAIANVPATIPVNAEPFTPTFKGTYGAAEFNTTSPTLSVEGPTSDDKTRYVEIINGAVYPRVAGSVTVVGTVNVAVAGRTEPQRMTASAKLDIVDAALTRVTLASAEAVPTTTVSVNQAIRFSATAEYRTLTQSVTSATVWVSADPGIAMVSNAAGNFGGAGKVTGVSPGGPVELRAYYRGKLVGTIPVTVVP
ncbi:MAG TPA: Ig-like domain-containing protein [Polyangiaceae bacterium]|nr:Ig-like domain-containing protein [Polyangiaceae bacterium]